MKPARKQPPKRGRPISDEEWIRRHFTELVDKYPGRYAVVAGGEAFIGYDPVRLDEEACKKHPGIIPQILRIPRPKDFSCAL